MLKTKHNHGHSTACHNPKPEVMFAVFAALLCTSIPLSANDAGKSAESVKSESFFKPGDAIGLRFAGGYMAHYR